MLPDHAKRLLTVRYRLRGRADENKAWLLACDALEYAAALHQGVRKDEVTLEFDHQLGILQYLMTLPNLMYPVETIATGALHDTPEDRGVSREELAARFGQMVTDATWLVTKVYRGQKKPLSAYFSDMAGSPIASIVKGGDRLHNLRSMNLPKPDGTPAIPAWKQLEQVEETRAYVIPMLKAARNRWLGQELAYQNIRENIEQACDAVIAQYGSSGLRP